MPKTLEQTKALQEKRKAAIKKAALSLFAINGFSGVSVDDICKASDSSHGLFYHYYSSLEEIYLELLNEADEKYLPPFEELSSLSGWIGINALIAYYEKALLAGKGPAIYYAMMSLTAEDETKLNPKIKKRIAAKKLFIKFIKEGQSEGKVIGGDIKEIVALTLYLMQSSYKLKLEKQGLISSFDIVLGMLNKAPVR